MLRTASESQQNRNSLSKRPALSLGSATQCPTSFSGIERRTFSGSLKQSRATARLTCTRFRASLPSLPAPEKRKSASPPPTPHGTEPPPGSERRLERNAPSRVDAPCTGENPNQVQF